MFFSVSCFEHPSFSVETILSNSLEVGEDLFSRAVLALPAGVTERWISFELGGVSFTTAHSGGSAEVWCDLIVSNNSESVDHHTPGLAVILLVKRYDKKKKQGRRSAGPGEHYLKMNHISLHTSLVHFTFKSNVNQGETFSPASYRPAVTVVSK